MHRPVIDWNKASGITLNGSIEQRVFSGTQKLLKIRKAIPFFADNSNLTWLTPQNNQVAAFTRALADSKVYCLFNFSNTTSHISWYIFKEHGITPSQVYDHWTEKKYKVGLDWEHFEIEPYGIRVFERI